MTTLQDIKPDWLKVILRLQQIARTQPGCAVISISVVVNADGIPLFWEEPTRTRLEPRATAEEVMSDVLKAMRG